MRTFILALMASLLTLLSLTPTTFALPLEASHNAPWAKQNSPTASHTLSLPQPASDLQPLVATPDDDERGNHSSPGVDRRYSGQKRFWETKEEEKGRRGRRERLLEYLA